MIVSLDKRKTKEKEALQRPGDEEKVSDAQLFNQLGNKIKVKKWQ